MTNFIYKPYKDNKKIRVELLKVDNRNATGSEKEIVYGRELNQLDFDELISVDLRKLKYDSIELLITSEVETNLDVEHAILRFNSKWTNYSSERQVSKESVSDEVSIFKTNFSINKIDISGKCELRIDFLDSNNAIKSQTKIFFIQSDTRIPPDLSDGMFKFTPQKYTKDGNPNSELSGDWWKEVENMGGINELFALKFNKPEEPIEIVYNSSFPGNIKKEKGLESEEITVNRLLRFLMGYGPFLIECIRSKNKIVELIDGDYDMDIFSNSERKDELVELGNDINQKLKQLKPFEKQKIMAISQLLFPDMKNENEGSVVHMLKIDDKTEFENIMQKATIAYQKSLVKFSERIDNDVESIRKKIRPTSPEVSNDELLDNSTSAEERE